MCSDTLTLSFAFIGSCAVALLGGVIVVAALEAAKRMFFGPDR